MKYDDFPAQTKKRSSLPMRLFGLLMVAIGVAGWWYNRHLAATQGEFSIKLCLLGPLGLFGGLMVAVRPDWAGPWRSDSTRAHKAALIILICLMTAGSGLEFLHLKSGFAPAPSAVNARVPRFDVSYTPSPSASPAIAFLGHAYQLASFNQRKAATWEFVPAGESIDRWTSLLTIIDRPEARTRDELDRLAEGIMSSYKSHGAKILAAKTISDESGAVFNYMVAAFDEAPQQRYEINFVKIVLGQQNAVVAVYSHRIGNAKDYRARAADFVERTSSEVGRELGKLSLPDLNRLPRREF